MSGPIRRRMSFSSQTMWEEREHLLDARKRARETRKVGLEKLKKGKWEKQQGM